MEFKRIDIHAHVNFDAFDQDRDEVIRRAHESGTAIINVGTQLDTSREALELAKKYDTGVYTIVGLHPVHTGTSHHDEKEFREGNKDFTVRGEIWDPAPYKELLKHPKVVGIGECGLDYFHVEGDALEKQKEVFISQIELANEAKKPLMLHIRNAYKDALPILKSHAKVRGNSHFFAGTKEEAQGFLDLGYTLSFTGVITFAKQYAELIEYVPLDMMQVETDCPYVAPAPYRGKRNEPAYVSEVTKKIAEIKKLNLAQVEAQLLQNSVKFFDLKL